MSFQGLLISLSGMQASQAGLNVTNQNIANTNTENYSRKVVNQNDANTLFIAQKDVPSGVYVEEITRAKNFFLDLQYRNHVADSSYYDELSTVSSNINDLLGTPGNIGINEKLQDFYIAANDLAANPELPTLKNTFVNAAKALTESFNALDDSMVKVKEDIDTMPNGILNGAVQDLNTTLEAVSNVQKQINLLKAIGRDATSLQDQRDALLDELNSFIDLDIKLGQNGEFFQVRANLFEKPNLATPAEPEITGTVAFTNPDSNIAGIGAAANNTLEFTIDDGVNGPIPYTVNFEANSSARQVVERINQTFRNTGGVGSIASLNEDNQLFLSNRLIEGAQLNATSSIQITAGSTALAALGLAAGPAVTGVTPRDVILLDSSGKTYDIEVDPGNGTTNPHPAKLILFDQNGVEQGTILSTTGKVTGLIDATNKRVPQMKKELSDFAMAIKDMVNGLFNVGNQLNGDPGVDLFTGNTAGDFAVATNIINDNSLIAVGESTATGIGSGDNTIVSELAELFFEDTAIVSDSKQAEKLYLRASDNTGIVSSLALIENEDITIDFNGLIDDNGTLMNAGDNNLPDDSLIEIEFINAAGAVVSTVYPNSGNPPPNDSVSYTGTVPVGTAFVRFSINNTSFNDNDMTNNYGHFGIDIYQNSAGVSKNINTKIAKTIGSLGQIASIDIENRDTSDTLREAIDNQRVSISGVSLEEEAANLLVFQNAFSANARAFSTMNQILDEILRIL
ncbi:MAG: hypothetical protein HRT47_04745 [Candidatus Caenarcaniphilales bacterium]|nr:hypothetical protein [Candidatus Caenarcaniphilales bacterium]